MLIAQSMGILHRITNNINNDIIAEFTVIYLPILNVLTDYSRSMIYGDMMDH